MVFGSKGGRYSSNRSPWLASMLLSLYSKCRCLKKNNMTSFIHKTTHPIFWPFCQNLNSQLPTYINKNMFSQKNIMSNTCHFTGIPSSNKSQLASVQSEYILAMFPKDRCDFSFHFELGPIAINNEFDSSTKKAYDFSGWAAKQAACFEKKLGLGGWELLFFGNQRYLFKEDISLNWREVLLYTS